MYFARSGSGSYLLSCEALLRLDEPVDRDVVGALMPALTAGRSFHEACAELPAEQQALARDFLGFLQAHGLLVATPARSSKPAPLPEVQMGDRPLVVTGDGALAAGFVAALRQCDLNVRVGEPRACGRT